MLPAVSTLSAMQGLPTAVAACRRGISTSVGAAAHWWKTVEQVGLFKPLSAVLLHKATDECTARREYTMQRGPNLATIK